VGEIVSYPSSTLSFVFSVMITAIDLYWFFFLVFVPWKSTNLSFVFFFLTPLLTMCNEAF
jgi:uncharacterized membrane protein